MESRDGTADPDGAEFHAAWVTELERLEVDVAAAEALLTSDSLFRPVSSSVSGDRDETGLDNDPWTAPRMRGPLPSDLEPRARLVLERQLAVAALLTERLTETGRHRRLTERIRANAEVDIPVYLDVRA